ncbi:MAG: hypothetical protein WBQ69_00885 [Gallionella sp.]
MKELSGIGIFFAKSIIAAIVFFAVVTMLLPNIGQMREEWKDFASKRENQALILSFIQNPVALTISGERDMERKNYSDAALKFELAVGLLEMHGASAATIQPYQARLLEAKKLAEQSAGK